jgi:hypothetical protein
MGKDGQAGEHGAQALDNLGVLLDGQKMI